MRFATVSHQNLNFTTVSRDRHAGFYERVAPGTGNFNLTTVSHDRHARFYERVAPSTTRSQFYYSFARSTRTILRKGILRAPARFRFYYSFPRSTRRIVCRGAAQKIQFYYSFARSTRTKVHRKKSNLLQFRAIDRHDLTKGLHFRKHFLGHGAPPYILGK